MAVRQNSRRMRALRDEFFEAGRSQDADPETRHLSVCWLCKERIDYMVGQGETSDAHHLDHYVTVKDRPDLIEDPSNFRHAHKRCNLHRGTRAPSAGLGKAVGDWW